MGNGVVSRISNFSLFCTFTSMESGEFTVQTWCANMAMSYPSRQ